MSWTTHLDVNKMSIKRHERVCWKSKRKHPTNTNVVNEHLLLKSISLLPKCSYYTVLFTGCKYEPSIVNLCSNVQMFFSLFKTEIPMHFRVTNVGQNPNALSVNKCRTQYIRMHCLVKLILDVIWLKANHSYNVKWILNSLTSIKCTDGQYYTCPLLIKHRCFLESLKHVCVSLDSESRTWTTLCF